MARPPGAAEGLAAQAEALGIAWAASETDHAVSADEEVELVAA